MTKSDMKKILIIEDDPAISSGLKASLEDAHYDVLIAEDGESGYNAVKEETPDLIILDLVLPDKDGMDICRELRTEGIGIPILMLTSRKEEMDIVLGLEIGADDYVTKPFSVKELLARIKVLFRRKNEVQKALQNYNFADVSVDFIKMEAYKGKKKLAMSLKEFEILKFFFEHEDEVVSRHNLLDKVWGYDVFPTTRTVDNYILMLRKKLEDNPSVPKHILTIHSAGYKFVK